MKTWGIIAAAGTGARLGFGKPKAFLKIAGRPVVQWSLTAFDACSAIDGVSIVGPPGFDAALVRLQTHRLGFGGCPGGPSRQASVRAGLGTVPDDVDAVVIHDAARPVIGPELIERALAGLEHADAAVCAIPVADTLKRVADERVIETVERAGLWRAQTPQAFRLSVLLDAHARAEADGFEATDDAQLVERYGGRVVLVPGDERNVKVTTREDLVLAEALLTAGQLAGRSGIGYDAHRFADGRTLVLGGVTIPHARGLTGHSDADVVCHAIADAVLGAAALGDLGEHFPSSDPRWEAMASTEFLRTVARMVDQAGLAVGSVDCTAIIEAPSIAPHRDEMRKRIAEALGIDVERVSVKASTTDEMGHIGRGEGAAAVAIARLEPR